ncbi:MAG: sugar phosphate isomerase/epimerase [Bryobacteraceae bacterium]|nr:sugar phosphate isomerase/epimerase [Solibacteraceae bacterium]MCL4842400.1 sugar phosphate isomerase/epimerase [Bryobacteraceae bacterium]MCO5351956.1 sugar phosphate isomerase/epimerase [Bryobacteraceae bacterium]
MSFTRRSLLASAALAPLATQAPAQSPASGARRRIPLAVSSYSYWHFKTEKYPIEKVIDQAAKIGFDGVEILHRQMASETPAYVNGLKRRALEQGLCFPMLSIHQDFVFPDRAERQKHIDHTLRCLELSARLGIPCMRLNSGRWKTIPSFDDLMKVKGDEPPVPGYTNDDAIKWCVESIQACLPEAEDLGVMMALENHWGLTTSVDTLLKIHSMVNSPWLGLNMDTGNYPGDPYGGIAQLAPKATIVQAKTYYGGGEWYTLDLDYPRIAGILYQHNFNGWISLEMEGKENPETAVPKSYQVLRQAFS